VCLSFYFFFLSLLPFKLTNQQHMSLDNCLGLY
jgi:hypothetical protein